MGGGKVPAAHTHTHTHTHTTHRGLTAHGPWLRRPRAPCSQPWRPGSVAGEIRCVYTRSGKQRGAARETDGLTERERQRETETERESRAHLVPGGRPRPPPSRRVPAGQQRVLSGGRRLRARVEARDDRAVVRALPELLAQQLQEHLVCNVLGRLEELGAQLGVSDDPLLQQHGTPLICKMTVRILP